jgi:hypothetical protein
MSTEGQMAAALLLFEHPCRLGGEVVGQQVVVDMDGVAEHGWSLKKSIIDGS